MDSAITKAQIFDQLENKLIKKGFTIEKQDQTRPWGGFFVIDEGQAQLFADSYFNATPVNELKISGKLSPKILVVAPEKTPVLAVPSPSCRDLDRA